MCTTAKCDAIKSSARSAIRTTRGVSRSCSVSNGAVWWFSVIDVLSKEKKTGAEIKPNYGNSHCLLWLIWAGWCFVKSDMGGCFWDLLKKKMRSTEGHTLLWWICSDNGCSPRRVPEKMMNERYIPCPTRAVPQRPSQRHSELAPPVPRRLRWSEPGSLCRL